MSEYRSFIEHTLKKSAEVARKSFGNVSGEQKGSDSNQVLTETDLTIGKLIAKEIRQKFPNHNLIDEEAGVVNNDSEYTWVIDPIDGTSNFAVGLPQYGIMIGLLERETPVAGGVVLPSYGELYVAESGEGATCNNKPIRVTSERNLLNLLVAYHIDSHREDPTVTREEIKLLGEIVLNVRNTRSSNACYDAVMVARGRYGACMNRTTKIWDNVAQHVIVQEAGGKYTDFFGKPMDYSNGLSEPEANYTYCAAPPELHEKLQKIIHGQFP